MPSKQISSQRCHRDIYWKLSTGGFTPSFTGQATEVSSSPFALTTAEFMYYATLDHVIGMRDRVTSAVIAGCKNCGCYFVIHSLQERKDNSTIREQREQGEQPRVPQAGTRGGFLTCLLQNTSFYHMWVFNLCWQDLHDDGGTPLQGGPCFTIALT
jgi:hypothetical protein